MKKPTNNNKEELVSAFNLSLSSIFEVRRIIEKGFINDKNQSPLISRGEREICYVGQNKFYELVDLNNSSDEYIVCIGVNPKMINPNAMDDSNIRLVNYCVKKVYRGYLLLNLFSYRTDNINELKKHKSNSIDDLRNVIADFLQKIDNKIVLFYGKRCLQLINENLKNALDTIDSSRLFYSGKLNHDFCHISSNDYVDIYKKNNFKLW